MRVPAENFRVENMPDVEYNHASRVAGLRFISYTRGRSLKPAAVHTSRQAASFDRPAALPHL